MEIGDLVILKGAWAMSNSFMKGTELDDTDKNVYGLVINTGLDEFKEPAAHVVWLKDDEQTIEQQRNLELVNKK